METKEMIDLLRLSNNRGLVYLNDFQAIEIADRLEELEKQLSEKQPEWISVEDRLPEPMESVLIYDHKNKRIAICRFGNCSTDVGSFCSHWMPLPEPPKPKEPTFKDVFLEKFPKADIEDGDDGNSLICRNAVFFGRALCSQFPICSECWNQPYFEAEEEGEE